MIINGLNAKIKQMSIETNSSFNVYIQIFGETFNQLIWSIWKYLNNIIYFSMKLNTFSNVYIMASCCYLRQTQACSHSCLGHCSDVDHYAVSWDNIHFPESASSDKMAWFWLRCKGAWQCCHVHLMRWLVCQTDKTKGLERLEGSLALILLKASRQRKFRFPDQSWPKGLRKKKLYM